MSNAAEHDRLYSEAIELSQNEILLHGDFGRPAPGWWVRRKLRRAISLLERALLIHPANAAAMFVVGKIHQRLGDHDLALTWLERAHRASPDQPDMAREAAIAAMDLGRQETAVALAEVATRIAPNDPGHIANLALAYLLANRVPDALSTIQLAIDRDCTDDISIRLLGIIEHFAAGRETPPSNSKALDEYLQSTR